MGKRGKAARKRRRENEVVNTAPALVASQFIASADGDVAGDDDDDSANGGGGSDAMAEGDGMHGIPDAALDTTVATLHRLCGLVDPITGRHALRDKRYRGLRRVLYELRNGGCFTDPQSSGANGASGAASSSSTVGAANGSPTPPRFISSSRITREVSAQIENGAWEMAVNTLRGARRGRDEARRAVQWNEHASKGTAANCYSRPKLGAVQRWVRQLDAAGTDDPLALGVLDAILRLVSPETMLPVDEVDIDKATWARLGVVDGSSSDGDGIINDECGRVRLFPQLDLRRRGPIPKLPEDDRVKLDDIVDSIVSWVQVGEDGIRRISCPKAARKAHMNVLFRRCGFEKSVERVPPNHYDLEIVTTAPIVETRSPGSCHFDTLSGNHILLENCESRPIAKTPLPYVKDSFLLENVLSPTECDRLIASAELAGYHPDEPMGGQPGASILAHACVWVVDHKLERTIFERVKRFLPSYEQYRQEECSGDVETLEPLGLNRRFRFYRYVPGRYYRPHIDGAWPPSGFDGEGNYRYDICDVTNKNGLQFVSRLAGADEKREDFPKQLSVTFKKECHGTTSNRRRELSRLTFLIYLNDDFDGGHTTFLIPDAEKEGVLNAFPVNPVRGGILVFPHGSCAAPLHEGSPVLKRCKYVVRTEVEYFA
ncbi:hypothetical protein ACHAXA_005601 [Cyclostephanos tholiformis]|uniref:Fe2OG dioxygenase domain-containing protein n=1 Tax=Cyclostephanos tholiformis TaxID=382380 RepID=A0ABD3SGN8_9STRA